jgi:hypothetical protein
MGNSTSIKRRQPKSIRLAGESIGEQKPSKTDEIKSVVFKMVTKEEHEHLRIPIYRETYRDLYIP